MAKAALSPDAVFRKKYGIKPKGAGPHAPSDYGLPLPPAGHPLAQRYARAVLSRAKAAIAGGRFDRAAVIAQVRKANSILYGKPAPTAADKVRAQKRRNERDIAYHFGEAIARESLYGIAPDGSWEQLSNSLQDAIRLSSAFGGPVIPYSVDPENTEALRPGDIGIAASYPVESKILVANYRTGDFWTVPYSVGEDGKTVTLGTPAPSEIIVAARAKEALREARQTNPAARLFPFRLNMMLAPIAEAGKNGASADDVGPVRMVACRMGHGNAVDKNYYDETFIESLIPLLAGCDAYYDHPSAFDERNRPERAIRDKAGWYSDPEKAPFKDPTVPGAPEVPAAYAVFNPREGDPEIASLLRTWRKKAEKYPEKAPFIAFSINGFGVGAPGTTPDGAQANINSKCVELRSVDCVTNAGAGGQPILEADPVKRKPAATLEANRIDPALGIDVRTPEEKAAAADELFLEARRATVRDMLKGPTGKSLIEAAGVTPPANGAGFSDDDLDKIADKTGMVKGGAMHQMMKDNLSEDAMDGDPSVTENTPDPTAPIVGQLTQADIDALPDDQKALLRKAGVIESKDGKLVPAAATPAAVIAENKKLAERVAALEAGTQKQNFHAVVEAACEKLKIPAPHRVLVERQCVGASSNDEIATIVRAYHDAHLVGNAGSGATTSGRPTRESRGGEPFKPSFLRTR